MQKDAAPGEWEPNPVTGWLEAPGASFLLGLAGCHWRLAGLGAALTGSLPPSRSPLGSLFFRSDTHCNASEVIRFPQPHRALWQPGRQCSLTGMMEAFFFFALNKPLQGSSKVCCVCGLFFQKILLHVVPV